MLVLKKPRLDFNKIFKNFLSSYVPVSYNYNNFWDDDYSDYWDDDYLNYIHDSYYPHVHSHKIGNTCTVKKGKKKKSKIYDNASYKSSKSLNKKKYGRYNDLDSSIGYDAKTIYYYRDINDPNDYEEFYNLFDFDEFLRDNGIKITEYEVQKILNRDVSHCCCINQFGEPYLLSDNAYGTLYFEANEECYS